jgi:sRNA-binding carbon storage regulator CsrA|tara:strand:+ start:1379 stop:1561 length:183 start_codon:yes stop_codon:yes gene_type:complete
MERIGGLVLNLKKSEQLAITTEDGSRVVIRLVSSGKHPRVVINAPKEISINREKIVDVYA